MVAGIFGASPVQPLEKHIDLGQRAASELEGFFDAVIAEDWETAGRVHARIGALEAEAENLKKEIRLHLPKSLFMPVQRQDILELLSVQDRVPDLALEIAGIVLFRRMMIPESIRGNFTDFVARTVHATARARESVRELDELFTAGAGTAGRITYVSYDIDGYWAGGSTDRAGDYPVVVELPGPRWKFEWNTGTAMARSIQVTDARGQKVSKPWYVPAKLKPKE